MAVEKVKTFFKAQGIGDRVKEFNVSSATVAQAAAALNTSPERIAKSIGLKTKDGVIVIVTAGDAKLDNHKYKTFFGEKAHMLAFDEVESLTGHPVGGVCPFALNDGITVYLDESLKRFETVFPACGSTNSAIELTVPEMEKYSGYKAWIDVCKIAE